MTDEPSLDALFQRALAATDEDAYWTAVCEVHRRTDRAGLDVLLAALEDPEPTWRKLAADGLSQYGYPEGQPWGDERVTSIVRRSTTERDPVVLAALMFALGHLRRADTAPWALPHLHHPEPEVRWGVAMALCGLDDEDAIAGLITLSTDPDDDVRNWATFGLASQTEVDTPALREALNARLLDPALDHEIAMEAAIGLGLRKDVRALPVLALLLEEGFDVVEAAEALAHPDLVAALTRRGRVSP